MKIAEQINTEGLTFLGIPLDEHEREYMATAKPAEVRAKLHAEDIQNGIEQAGIDLTDIMSVIPFDRLMIVANNTVLDEIDDECPLLYNRIFDAFLSGAPYHALKRAAKLLTEEIDELEKSIAERGCEPAELADVYETL